MTSKLSNRNYLDALAGAKLKSALSKGQNRTQKEAQTMQTVANKLGTLWKKRNFQRKEAMYRRKPWRRGLTPLLRFRLVARAIALVLNVCKVCRDMQSAWVTSQPWYQQVEDVLSDSHSTVTRPRPFTAIVINDSQKIEKISFDQSEYSREFKAEVLICLRQICEQFNGFSLDMQKDMCKVMTYDLYDPNRVIIRKNLMSDGIYLLLSGTLVEKSDEKRQLQDIRPGRLIGEEDLICGSSRKSTVLTKTKCEILSLHSQDYRSIFNMAEDSGDHRHLDVCKHDVLFQNFPIEKLEENPGVWTVLSYKFGRLICKDCNETEWIYVIKSGEAKVLKRMETEYVQIGERKSLLEARRETETHKIYKKRLFQFTSGTTNISSQYTQNNYKPPVSRQSLRNTISSAKSISLVRVDNSDDLTANWVRQSRALSAPTTAPRRSKSANLKKLTRAYKNKEDSPFRPKTAHHCSNTKNELEQFEQRLHRPKSTVSFLETGKEKPEKKDSRLYKVPPYVKLDSLTTGRVFGLRSMLPEEERGASVSLISGGCVIVQISRKFLSKFMNDSLIGLIRMHHKPYPSEENLLCSLDTKIEWEDYKEKIMKKALRRKGLDRTMQIL